MANAKTIFADGDVIFREDDLCKHAFEVLSGAIDLLKQKSGKYARRGKLKSGDVFGKSGMPYEVTIRAKGRTVLRQTDRLPNVDLRQNQSTEAEQPAPPKEGMISALLRRLAGPVNKPNSTSATKPYSDLGFIRRLIDELSSGGDRIGVRVALLDGDDTKENTRRLISALGNNPYMQTKGFKSPIKLDPEGDILQQHNRIAIAARRWLFLQGADVLIWGYVSPAKQVMHLHFVTLTNWDQQAPGSFDLETTLTLPVEFAPEFADVLRAITLAAALPRTGAKRQLRQQALGDILAPGAAALNSISQSLSNREQASIHMCFANVLATASRPGYTHELLAQASDRYRVVLTMISEDDAPYDWAYAQKHLGSILHIEAERQGSAALLEEAAGALGAANRIFSIERHPKAWAIVQNRLGLIRYRSGFEDGDTELLREALNHFTNALKVFSRQDAPLRWAEIMSNFAQAAQVLGGHLKSMEALATAANACRSVLDVRSRKKNPLAWAATQNNLGSALFLLGKQSQNAERIRAAINAFEHALVVYKEAGSGHLSRVTEKNLNRAQSVLDILAPSNLPTLDWEDQPGEAEYDEEGYGEDEQNEGGPNEDGPIEDGHGDVLRLPEPGEGLVDNDLLPVPGEGLGENNSDSEPEWFRQAV